jgi:nucleoside-diphosphate-sugar epimerase
MKAMVTGATGFIGSHLAERLASQGYEVVCPVRDTGALGHLRGTKTTVTRLDDLHDQLSRSDGPDYLFHVAGATRGLDYDAYRAANVELTRQLLNSCAMGHSQGPLKKFVLVSSQAVAGPSPDDGAAITEDRPPVPISLYGRSKQEAEEVAKQFMDRVPVTIVRPPTVFGPRDRDVLGIFGCARFRFVPCLAGPDRLVSIIYVEDLVDGIVAAGLSERAAGQTYFLANPEPVVWRKFVLLVARVLGYRAMALPLPIPLLKLVALVNDIAGKLTGRPRLFRREKLEEARQIAWVCSSEKAYADLGWRARVPISEAIARTGKWYRDQGWI